MEAQSTRIAPATRTAPANERDILDRIVDAMLAAEQELCNASVQEWTRVLTDSCRNQKHSDGETLATTC